VIFGLQNFSSLHKRHLGLHKTGWTARPNNACLPPSKKPLHWSRFYQTWCHSANSVKAVKETPSIDANQVQFIHQLWSPTHCWQKAHCTLNVGFHTRVPSNWCICVYLTIAVMSTKFASLVSWVNICTAGNQSAWVKENICSKRSHNLTCSLQKSVLIFQVIMLKIGRLVTKQIHLVNPADTTVCYFVTGMIQLSSVFILCGTMVLWFSRQASWTLCAIYAKH